ncbi:pyridoxal phosphate-dependent aminotransferase [Luteitalea sp.]|uniref:pyridoxal phosphate-dependent aminotransferase n=1 Tax=Luteitalea sp. TaxID=2004800 RepID=UPI0025B7F240|nr:pyridoxal phosphate-dependent aminotransferase [Luteitalea sp.]
MLAERTTRISSSPTMKGLIAAERLRQAGVDVVDLSAGEPDFPTPAHVKEAAHAAITGNFTKYTPNSGTTELKRVIAARYKADYGVDYDEAEIIVTAGGKQALVNAALTVFGPGDEVITHSPGWPTIVEQIKLAEATPVIVTASPDDGFALRADPFLAAITPRTRAIVINSPANPTGALMTEGEMIRIADAAAARGIWVILDLCYEKLIYDPAAHNLPRVLVERMRDRTILTGSASKAYAMTGWRCGWLLASREVVAACNAIQSHSTSNVCSITQKAVVAALGGPQQCVTDMLDEYRRRRDFIWALLSTEPRLVCARPAGAFYLFVDVSALLSPDGLRTSAAFCQALLETKHVVVTAGEAFDAPGFFRVSYAASMERLEEAARRIHAFIGDLDAGVHPPA